MTIDTYPIETLPPFDHSRLVRLCAHITGNPDAAEDLAQETLLEAWRHRARLTEPAGYDRWLTAIARNVCRRWVRRHSQAEHTSVPANQATLEQQLDPFDIEIELERDELAVLLDRALAQLPATTRAALLARYIEEQPVANIAARLGLSVNATAVRLHRGKLALRQTLTSDLRDETSAYTLVSPNDTTRVTSIWCPFCGQHRLIMRHSHTDRYAFWLGCPDCRSVAGRYFVLMQHTRPFVEPLNDHHLIAHITAEVSQRFRQDLARGETLCHRCGRRLAMRMSILGDSHPSGGARIAGTRCLRCDIESWIYFSELVLYLPESQRFWHKHGRIRTLPERAVAAEGRTALITRFETLDACAYLEVVALRDTAEVVCINESAQ